MDFLPLKMFLEKLTLGLVRPRAVARAVIDARPDGRERLLIVGLAAAMQGMFWALIGVIAPGAMGGAMAGGLGPMGQLALASLAFVNYVLVAMLAYFIGRAFGGAGKPSDVAAAIAWHSVLSAALTPVQAMIFRPALPAAGAESGAGGGSVMLLGFYIGYNLWLLGSCVAEAHGFRSTGRVVAATAAVAISIGAVLTVLVAAGRG
ncbi:YIP1 family protein [Rubrimonas sp.]|uniref:YIP1 family protein n=1 Tax=Rubrimonas sp. TaxID=2036015 RepID=UPI002FDD0B90